MDVKNAAHKFLATGVRVLDKPTPIYYKGMEIRGTGIVPGTVIATFIDKCYPSKVHGNHVAIYLGQTKNSISVIDQWNIKDNRGKIIAHQKIHTRNIYVGGSGLSNNADAFSVVYTLTGGY